VLAGFWENHDPTQGDRQGNDIGSNYRSAIYTHGDAQLRIAQATKTTFQTALAAGGYGAITTEIANQPAFWFAEPYHQQYLAKPGSRPYCSAQPSGQRLGELPGLRGRDACGDERGDGDHASCTLGWAISRPMMPPVRMTQASTTTTHAGMAARMSASSICQPASSATASACACTLSMRQAWRQLGIRFMAFLC
jgi:hypothetical protein